MVNSTGEYSLEGGPIMTLRVHYDAEVDVLYLAKAGKELGIKRLTVCEHYHKAVKRVREVMRQKGFGP